MKKLFALLMALTMTFQLVTPAWADTVEEHTHENTSTVEETTEAPTEETAPPTEETAAPTEEAPAEETTVSTEETTAPAEAEPSETPEEDFGENDIVTYSLPDIHLPEGMCSGCRWSYSQCYQTTQGKSNWRANASSSHPGQHSWWCAMGSKETAWEYHDMDGANGACSVCGHVHTLTLVEAKAPTATEKGNNAYYTCSGCYGVYLDAAASQMTKVADETLPKLSDNTCGSNLTWGVDENGTLTISGTGAMTDYAYSPRAPWYGYRTRITAVVVEAGVTSIGSFAFNDCSHITTVTLPAELTAVANYAFDSCTSLTDVAYGGRIADWKNITIALHNDPLLNAAIHYMPGHAHELTKVNAVVSCTEAGVAEHYVCDICGALFADAEGTEPTTGASLSTPAAGHDLTLTEAVAAGHTTPGSNSYYTCARCGKLFKDAEGKQETTLEAEVVPAEGHTMVKTEAVAPTYFAPGNNEYYTCSVCGKVYKDAEGLTETTVADETLAMLSSAASGKFGRDDCLSWVLTEDGTLTISGSGEMPSYSETVTAPWYAKRMKITSVVIGSGVTYVGSYAFNACLKLTSVDLPAGVIDIGSFAFQNCSKLTSVKIPASVKWIGQGAFYGCTSLESVTLPENAYIGSGKVNGYSDKGAFEACTGLTSVTVPAGARFTQNTFAGCTSLTSISIPESMTEIPHGSFKGCTGLTSVTIPKSVTKIANFAFSGCTSLNGVTIPDSVTSVGHRAFEECSGLTSVHIPDSVISIGTYAFYGCSGLKSIRLPEGITSIGQYTFYGCASLESVTIPDSVTSIDENAFYDCAGMVNVHIPEGVVSIAWGAFANCSSLKSVTIPETVTSIGASAFSGCTALTSVNIPEGIASIESGTFEDCSSLVSISIPETVESIGYAAFRNCSSLKSVTISGNVTVIKQGTFYNCISLECVELPDGLLSIADADSYGGAFENCSSLNGIVIPDSVTSIGNKAFSGCRSLTNVTIPEGVTSISDSVFSGCSGLTSAHIPESVTGIGDFAFSDCSSLTSINVPKNVTRIGRNAFYKCSGLKNVYIPDTVTSIGVNALYGNSALTDIYFGGDEAAWNSIQVTGYNPGLTNAYIHYGVDHICQLTLTAAAAPTCTEEGNNAYYTCGICSRVYKDEFAREQTTVQDETLAALGHTMEKTEAAAATCTESGHSAYFTCTVCGKLYLDEKGTQEATLDDAAIPALGHTMVKTEAKAPTDTENGNNTYYTCETCHKVFKDEAGTQETTVEDETLPSLEHHELTKVEAKDPTCTQTGNREYYSCSICGKLYRDETAKFRVSLDDVTIPALGHEMVETEAVEATYWNSGNNAYYTCTRCGKVYKDIDGRTETTVEAEQLEKLPSIALGTCDKLTWVLTEDGVLNISGSGPIPTYNTTTNVAPWYAYRQNITSAVLSEGVTAVGYYAFYACYRLEQINVPRNVQYIGEGAFYGCTALQGIVLPDGLGSIGRYAFRDCKNLQSVNIPESVTWIGNSAFYNCEQLRAVVIPGKVTTISNGTFSHCESLESAVIREGVQIIEGNAFNGCSGLTELTLPESLKEIQRSAFADCSSLKEIVLPESVTSIGDWAFSGCGSLEKLNIPANLNRLSDSLFYGCSSLTDAVIPNGVTSIGDSTFSGCSSLTSVSIPESVTSIGNYAFSSCSSLTGVSIPESVTGIGDSAFSGCSGLTSVRIPESVTSIGSSAFYSCSGLTSVSIPESVTSIGRSAFSGCSGLTSVSIPESVTSIGASAFYGCSSLASVSVPEGVTSIGGDTFYDCSGLTSVSIPVSLTSVEGEAFRGCTSLKDVYYGGDEVDWKQISIGYNNERLTSAYIYYAATHICTLHLIPAVTPTCTTGGNNAYYLCDACGRVYKDELGRELTTVEDETLAALGHSMTETAAKAATCIDDGNNVYYTCGNCHKVFKDEAGETETTVSAEILPALGHAIIRVDTVAPTCTEKGNRVYYLCTTCQRAFKDKAGTEATTVAAETIPALGHSMTKTEAVAPTCTEKGNNAYYTCATCRKVYQDQAGKRETTVEAETLNALGHTMEVITATEPTCTEIGYPDYVLCTVCHKIFLDRDGKQETTLAEIAIPALGHSMEKTEAVAPTCTESGNNAYYTCSTCGKVYKDEQGNTETSAEAEVLNALGHTMEKTEAVAPTCTEKGNNAYYTCSACRKVYKDEQGNAETTTEAEVLEALGHSMEVTEAREPTCTETGNNTYWTCSTCHKVFTDELGENETSVSAETIPALGHSMVKTEAVAPTCTESGNNEYYTCSTCGKIYKDGEGNTETSAEAEVLNALGHTMEKTEAVAPTHTAGGNNAYYTCRTCGKVFQDAQGTRETTPEQEQLPRLPGIADGKCGGLTWLLNDEGVLTVSGKGRMPDYSGSALAPWYDYRNQITALEVEDGVTSIGSYAFFDCTGLTSVSLPESLTKLGRSCFSGCDSLELLDISGLPKELTQKVTDLSGIAKLSEMVSGRVGSSAVYTWALEDSKSAPAKLAGSELTVLRSGAFRLVCTEEYTGLTASAEVSVQTATVIHPEEREQLTGGDSLTLSVWAMPFETELKAKWSLDEASEAYASITEDGVLTAKAVTEPVQITVRAVPTAGEDSAEKTLWILPKTTAMGILADGHLVGDSLTIELTEKTGLTLTAQIQPQGAKAEVLWSSSRTDVAEIDQDGTVRFLKPGTTVIRAESQDGSGIAAELTLKGRYLDGAETLTLTSDMEEAGLEVGRTAKLTLSGENAIDPANVEFYVSQGTAATVDDQGLVTAGDVPGTVTIVAALKNDPLQRRAELTLQVVPTLVRALQLNAEVSQEWGYFEELNGEYTLYAEINEVAGKNRSFRLTALGSDYRDNWSEVTNLTFETSDPAVAQVSDNGTVTLTAAAAGVCTVTVRCTDSLRAEAQLRIVIRDRSPRLETSRLTLNSNLIAGVSTGLVDGGGNTVQSVTVYDYNKTAKAYETEPSQMFAAEAEDGTLTLRSLGAQKNGTYNVKLAVSCLSGTYEFLMQVKVANSLPAVTVKQLSKFNLFYLDSTAQLSVTAKNAEVEKVELVGADSFRLDDSGELSYAETFAPGDKAVTKGTLRITLAGYQVPVEKAFTVATVTTAPKLTTNPASSAINLALAEPECRVSILTNGQALDLTGAEITETAAFAEMENAGSHLVFRLTENKGGTVNMTLRLPGWTQAVKLSHRITAENKLPTVKLGTAALKLNSVFTRQTASTVVSLSQGNMDLGTMTFAPTAKEGTAARVESEKIALAYDPETSTLSAAITDPDNVPKNGTYSYTFTAALADGTELKGGTVRVSVVSTTPRVKLSAASVKLNRYLAGREQAVVTASMTGGTGYRLVGFEGMPAYMSFDPGTGHLTVTLPDADLTADTCTLLPVIADETTGQEATLNTKLTFKVQTMYSDKLTLSLTAKGKLDATKPESVLTYTVNRVNNCLGAVDNVFLEGENADMFQAELDTDGAKPIVTLRTVPGQVYATNRAYKLRFRFSVCGAEVMSNVLTVKVSQTALKVTVPRTTTFYLSQTAALRCNLTSNVPMESVSLNAKTSKEFLEALGGEENLRFDGTRLEFYIVNPGALKAGKTYTVQLDITPENCAENVKPTLVKLTVKVMK